MKKVFNIIIDYIKANQKYIIFYSISIVLITIAVIYLAFQIFDVKKEKQLNNAASKELLTDAAIEDTDFANKIGADEKQEVEELMYPELELTEIVEDAEKVVEENSEGLNENRDGFEEKKDDLEEEVPPKVLPSHEDEDPQTEINEGAKVDASKLPAEGSSKAEVSYGIDVAKWQGIIDWEKVKDAGVEFAMIRVGYRTQVNGVITEDPYAKYNLQQAQKYGIKIGVYFFSTAVNKKEAKEEAIWVTDFIAPYPITYPVAYNCEGFHDRNNRQYGMTKEERSNMAVAFLDYVKKQGYTPMFYASKSELENNSEWSTDLLSSKYKIWVAQYTSSFQPGTSVSSYSKEHAMWQYTSNGIVPGIKYPVDMNIAYFSVKKIAKPKQNNQQEEATPDPAALINFTSVNEKVTAKIETNLRTVPNSTAIDTIAVVLKNGDIAIRTGIGHNGWSRVEYNGQILYAVTSYLTTDLKPKITEPTPKPESSIPTSENPEAGISFTVLNEMVTAKEVTNLRLVPSTDSEDTIVIALLNGEIAIRTGIGSNGWSRVEYNGQILYAVSSFLMLIQE